MDIFDYGGIMLPDDCYLTEEQKDILREIAPSLRDRTLDDYWGIENNVVEFNHEIASKLTQGDLGDFVHCGFLKHLANSIYKVNRGRILNTVENNFGEPKNPSQQVKSTMSKYKGLETIHWEFLSALATAYPDYLSKNNEQDYYIKPELSEDNIEIIGFDGFTPEFYPSHKEQLNIRMSDFVKLVPLYLKKARQGNYYLNADKIAEDVKVYRAFLDSDNTTSSAPEFECDIFVVMPFRERLNPIYETVILSLQDELNIIIRRGDDSQRPSQAIMERVWQYLRACHVVIVDCTEIDEKPNGNVYYELGIADTLSDTEVILISQTSAEKLPFDIRHREIIHYEDNARGINELKVKLKNAIQSILEDQ